MANCVHEKPWCLQPTRSTRLFKDLSCRRIWPLLPRVKQTKTTQTLFLVSLRSRRNELWNCSLSIRCGSL
jgi:hypothetical protein